MYNRRSSNVSRVLGMLLSPFTVPCAGLLTAPLAAVRALPWARHLPEAVYHAYRVLYQTPRLGPNLKAVCAVLMVPGCGMVVPLALTAAAGYGLIGGMYDTFVCAFFGFHDTDDKGWGPVRTLGRMDTAGRGIIEGLVELSDYTPPDLKDDEKAYEVSPLRAILITVSSLVGTAVEAPTMLLIGLRHAPKVIWATLKAIWSDDASGDAILGQVLMTIILVPTVAVALALTPLACVIGSLGAHVRRAYTEGVKAAWSTMFQDFRSVHTWLSELGEGGIKVPRGRDIAYNKKTRPTP